MNSITFMCLIDSVNYVGSPLVSVNSSLQSFNGDCKEGCSFKFCRKEVLGQYSLCILKFRTANGVIAWGLKMGAWIHYVLDSAPLYNTTTLRSCLRGVWRDPSVGSLILTSITTHKEVRLPTM